MGLLAFYFHEKLMNAIYGKTNYNDKINVNKSIPHIWVIYVFYLHENFMKALFGKTILNNLIGLFIVLSFLVLSLSLSLSLTHKFYL